MTFTVTNASSASSFVNSIGINTHIDFNWTSYNDFSRVETALSYLGVKNVRDAIDNPDDPAKFQKLAADLGVKFDFFIAPGSVDLSWQLSRIAENAGITEAVEGPNESDNFPRGYNGLTGIAATQAIQQAVYTFVKGNAALSKLPVIQSSFGQAASFAQYGNMAAYADAANTHTYFGSGNAPITNVEYMIDQALQVTPGKPVITTEAGYYTMAGNVNGVSQTVQAKYDLTLLMDEFQAGVKQTYLYELLDQGANSGNTEYNFGLFNADGTPKLAATAVRNLIALLSDTQGATNAAAAPASLSFSLSGMPSTGNDMLLQQADGTYVLALWNDARLSGPTSQTDLTVAATPVTITLPDAHGSISVYDPLLGTTSTTSYSNTNQVTVSVPDHPVLVKISPGTVAAASSSLVAVPATSTALAWNSGPLISGLSRQLVATGTTTPIAGLSVTDGWAPIHAGNMTMTLQSGVGTLSVSDAGGGSISGSGSKSITVSGSFVQINAALASLNYIAAGQESGDTISIGVYDQLGLSGSRQVGVEILSAAAVNAAKAATSLGSVVASSSTSSSASASTSTTTTSSTAATSSTTTVTATTGTVTSSTPVATSSTSSRGTTSSTAVSSTSTASSASVVQSPPSLPTLAKQTVTNGVVTAIKGLSVADGWAPTHPGLMSMTINAPAGTVSVSDKTGATVTGSGTHSISVFGTYTQLNALLASLAYKAGTVGGDTIGITVYDQLGLSGSTQVAVQSQAASTATVASSVTTQLGSVASGTTGKTTSATSTTSATTTSTAATGPRLATVAAQTVKAGSAVAVTGLSVADNWAPSHPGQMAATVWDTFGNLSVTTVDGATITGSGTHGINIAGSFAQVNAALASLRYSAAGSAGTDTINVSVYNQLGQAAGEQIGVTVGAATSPAMAALAAPVRAVSAPVSGSASTVVVGADGSVTLGTAAAGAAAQTYDPGVSVIHFTDGTGVVDASGQSEDVARLYVAAFGGQPDLAGVQYWSGLMASGDATLLDVANAFAGTPQYAALYGGLPNSQVVDRMYANVLGHAPDASGEQYWTGQLDGGLSQAGLLVAFAGSPENIQNTIGWAGDNDQATAYRLYQAAFNHTPDAGGLGYWTAALKNGATPAQVADSFMQSPEAQSIYAGKGNDDFVSSLYQAVLGRGVDATGAQYWTDQINGGASRSDVLLNFAQSGENQVGTAAATHANWVFLNGQ